MKNFLIKVDVDNPLWQKFKGWIRKEHGLHTDKEVFQTGNLVGMYKGSSVFVDSLDMNVIDVPVITLEEWDRLVNGFVLPEKWCIRADSNSSVPTWFNKSSQTLSTYNNQGGYLHFPSTLYRHSFRDIQSGYTEITLEQFKKYVLKEKTEPCSYAEDPLKYCVGMDPAIGADSMSVNVFNALGVPLKYFTHADNMKYPLTTDECFKRVYTIKDLSEGRVAVINDGTRKELGTVLKEAFPEDKSGVNGGDKYYFRFSNKSSFWRGNDKTDLPTQSVKEFYKQLKTEKMDNRFPFKLSVVDAQRIIDSACPSWKEKLAEKWGTQILVDKLVTVSEQFYNNMRGACTEPQNKLFDEIFGKDVEQFKVGDWVVWTGLDTYVGRINKACPSFPGCWNIRLDKSDRGSYTSCHVTNLRKATPEEIAKAQCPYEDGELCWVKNEVHREWRLRYATGKVYENTPEFYRSQKDYGKVEFWYKHKSAKGVELPKD